MSGVFPCPEFDLDLPFTKLGPFPFTSSTIAAVFYTNAGAEIGYDFPLTSLNFTFEYAPFPVKQVTSPFASPFTNEVFYLIYELFPTSIYLL